MILTIILFGLVFLGMFYYRKSITVKKTKIPHQLHNLLEHHVLFCQKLTTDQKELFVAKVKTFCKETYIEAVGFKLKDLDIVLVAASAVIPVFYFNHWKYSNLSTVLICPDFFNKDLNFKGEGRNIGGLVGTGRFRHQMILSRKALHYGFTNKTDKGNTGIHEFVHLIDNMDSDTDGIPKALLTHTYLIPWLDLIHKEISSINQQKSDIRAYGATNQQEFFAVAAEYFFERPELLKTKHPELYKMMELCFYQK